MAKKKPKKTAESKVQETVRRIYDLMQKEELLEVSWQEDKDTAIRIRRKGVATVVQSPVQKKSEEIKEEKKPVREKQYIRSPMNGIFYTAASPGTDPYVEDGDEITPGTTVCIIEAMKLMNEVQVERDCRIVKTIAQNATPVKVNEPLFEIENI